MRARSPRLAHVLVSFAALGAVALLFRSSRADAEVKPREQPRPTHARDSARPALPHDQARVRSERAAALYQQGDYHGASAAYREAYRLRPSPGVLFNLGQSYRQDGRCEEAAAAYRGVLRAELAGPVRELASRQLEAVEVCSRALHLSRVRGNRAMRRNGLVTMGIGGAAMVVASGLALADNDRRDSDTSGVTVGVAVTGGAVLATGAIVYAIAQRRIRTERRIQPALWRAPVGTTDVAGFSMTF